MIEFRAMLRKTKKFEGGFTLWNGTIIYARETEHGWLGMYYEDKGTGHAFHLEEDDFSLLQSGQCSVDEIVVIPDPPEPPEKLEAERELARKRLQHRIRTHRETADELEKLLS